MAPTTPAPAPALASAVAGVQDADMDALAFLDAFDDDPIVRAGSAHGAAYQPPHVQTPVPATARVVASASSPSVAPASARSGAPPPPPLVSTTPRSDVAMPMAMPRPAAPSAASIVTGAASGVASLSTPRPSRPPAPAASPTSSSRSASTSIAAPATPAAASVVRPGAPQLVAARVSSSHAAFAAFQTQRSVQLGGADNGATRSPSVAVARPGHGTTAAAVAPAAASSSTMVAVRSPKAAASVTGALTAATPTTRRLPGPLGVLPPLVRGRPMVGGRCGWSRGTHAGRETSRKGRCDAAAAVVGRTGTALAFAERSTGGAARGPQPRVALCTKPKAAKDT